jgi:hypothetical protein
MLQTGPALRMANFSMLRRFRPIGLSIASGIAGFLLASLGITDQQANRQLPRVPFNIKTVEEDYAMWRQHKILESIPLRVLGESSTLEIVYNSTFCVTGFVDLSTFSVDVQVLEARLCDHQMTVVSYKDALWVKLSKRHYLRIK